MTSNKKIVYKFLDQSERRKFQKFVIRYWDKNHLFAKENSVFDWQHKRNNKFNYIIAKEGNDILGIQGLIPQSHFDKNLPNNQIFLTMWKAIENKGVSIGLQLYDNLIKKFSPEFIGVVGINNEIVSFYKWQGYIVGNMDHSVVVSPYINKFRIIKIPQNFKTKIKEVNIDVSYRNVNYDDLKRLNTNDLYKCQWPIKSDEYLFNRYIMHPIYNYDLYGIFENNLLKAICIIRPISKYNSVVLRIVDYIGSNENFSLLAGIILDLLKDYKAEYIDIYSHGIPLKELNRAGFVSRSFVNNLIIPNYFEPFVRENINVLFAYKKSKSDFPVRLFKGDGDQDRPNQIKE